MHIFKNLLSRLLCHGPALVLPTRPACWRSSGRALPCGTAVAAVSQNPCAPFMDCGDDKLSELPRLPLEHPHTVRARRIAADIIAAVWDDKVFRQRRLSERTGYVPSETFTELEVNVSVIDSCKVRAYSTLGDIFVFAGMMDNMEDDNYIATVLAHEIAHVVADHILWGFLKFLLVSVLINFVEELLEVPPGVERTRNAWSTLFMRPYSIRSELEADRSGLLLQSAAGYDPRVAPAVYLKLGMLLKEGDSDQNLTHPSSKRRAQALSQPEIMGEAIELYNTVSGLVAQTSQLPPTLAPQAQLQ